MPRLLIVSNRLPITIRAADDGLTVSPSNGGLASALRGPHEKLDALWIGWPGDLSRVSPDERRALDEDFARRRIVPVDLSQTEVERYYDGFSNGVLWPLFHYLLEKVNLDARGDWDAYREVNERFAAVVAAHHQPGDTIWVHDYQLMLLPELLRQRLPDAKIGFFLHIPFPASDVFRILPWRDEILRGLLGADLIGFHTASYSHHFAYAAARVLGIEIEPERDGIVLDGRRIALGVYPIGVDTEELERLAEKPEVQAEAQRIRAEAGGRRIVLGIDRLDYTKGIQRRMLAVDRLIEREPELRDAVRFIQVGVPTRERVSAYAEFRRVVHEMVGDINGRHGTLGAMPLHFVHRAFSMEQVVALYLSADVMLVTPLRDGMNLVAKEYVAVRGDDTGALVLSEFAGAAAELSEALQVNPHDVDSVARALATALSMPEPEQRVRMAAMRRRIKDNDVKQWTASFLDDLERAVIDRGGSPVRAHVIGQPLDDASSSARDTPALWVLLDYDGTLVPLAPMPDLAAPDDELLLLLRDLSERAHVHLVSGRSREDLKRWFGALPIGLHAEHGFWSQPPGGTFEPLGQLAAEWKGKLRPLLNSVTRRTPGSFVEEKTVTLAWHYRAAAVELVVERSRELCARLAERCEGEDLEIVVAAKAIEIRPRELHKGRVVSSILAGAPAGSAVVAIGDDRSDEALFAALPPSALTIHVGSGVSQASYRLPSPAGVRRFLRSLLP
ncbi:Alpha,alpha-trehalose-phosphate synthase [Minicystis rosea]|nr:Alpha,alpha-trehalose-phosphate synthase [Minicystis rosea]